MSESSESSKSNETKGNKLIEEASRIFKRDLTMAFQEQDYNLTMRRSQEVVELATKGALQILGVDYPKSHDVGLVLVQHARTKQCSVGDDVLDRIAKASSWLASHRSPSFYGEGDYSQADAGRAYEEAKFVLEAVQNHFSVSIAL